MNREADFLTGLVNRAVRVYLVNGIKLQGTLTETSPTAIFLVDREHGSPQLIYKTCIATVAVDEARSYRSRNRVLSSV